MLRQSPIPVFTLNKAEVSVINTMEVLRYSLKFDLCKNGIYYLNSRSVRHLIPLTSTDKTPQPCLSA